MPTSLFRVADLPFLRVCVGPCQWHPQRPVGRSHRKRKTSLEGVGGLGRQAIRAPARCLRGQLARESEEGQECGRRCPRGAEEIVRRPQQDVIRSIHLQFLRDLFHPEEEECLTRLKIVPSTQDFSLESYLFNRITVEFSNMSPESEYLIKRRRSSPTPGAPRPP